MILQKKNYEVLFLHFFYLKVVWFCILLSLEKKEALDENICHTL